MGEGSFETEKGEGRKRGKFETGEKRNRECRRGRGLIMKRRESKMKYQGE
jgi:hypothetical protein